MENRVADLENRVRQLEILADRLEALVRHQREELIELREQHKSLSRDLNTVQCVLLDRL